MGVESFPNFTHVRFRLYLADAAIAPAMMLKGKAILEDTAASGVATGTAVFKPLFASYAQDARFSYWRGKRDHEVDLSEVGGERIPFEVKSRAQHTGASELKGLIELCQARRIAHGCVVTKSLDDFGSMQGLPPPAPGTAPAATQIMRIPAPLLCYWMGAIQLTTDQPPDESA